MSRQPSSSQREKTSASAIAASRSRYEAQIEAWSRPIRSLSS
jgi:hypothetical protein